jgi:hypothetical protein
MTKSVFKGEVSVWPRRFGMRTLDDMGTESYRLDRPCLEKWRHLNHSWGNDDIEAAISGGTLAWRKNS